MKKMPGDNILYMCTIKSYNVWFLRYEARHAYSKQQILGFLRLEIHKKSTKNKRFQWAVPVKTSWTKKYKFNLYFTFKIINIDNRSYRKLFFSNPPLPTFLSRQHTKDFQLALHKPENSLLVPELVFPSK